jgi:hypothetical protein
MFDTTRSRAHQLPSLHPVSTQSSPSLLLRITLIGDHVDGRVQSVVRHVALNACQRLCLEVVAQDGANGWNLLVVAAATKLSAPSGAQLSAPVRYTTISTPPYRMERSPDTASASKTLIP